MSKGGKGNFWEFFEETVYAEIKKILGEKQEQDSSLKKWEVLYIKKSHRFPDITYEPSAKRNHGFGIEVKTLSSKTNKWIINGGSILESTRVDGIDAIYVLCAKKKDPLEIKCRNYEDCIVDISVTHSPRYKLDMDVQENYFKKHNTSYEAVRKDPVQTFKKILNDGSKKSKKGGEYWYGSDEEMDYIEAEKKRKTNCIRF